MSILQCSCGHIISGREYCDTCNEYTPSMCLHCHNSTFKHQQNRKIRKYMIDKNVLAYNYVFTIASFLLVGIGLAVIL